MKLTTMQKLILTYLVILVLGIASYLTGIPYYANIAGFIGAVGAMLIFFKDRPELEEGSEEAQAQKSTLRMWYVVFGTGIFFSLIFGSLWNHHMGNMVGS